MNAIGWLTLGLLVALSLFARARWALLGLSGGVLYMTLGQAIEVLGLSIYPMRVLTLAAFVRVLLRGEWSFSMLNGIDTVVLLVYGYRTVVFILNGNGNEINAIGLLIDVTLVYFASRGLLRSFEDLTWFLRALALLLVPYVVILWIESSTGHNPFLIVGGIDQFVTRNGLPRCIGSFGHASILGTFGASFLPLFFALLLSRTSRPWGILGMSLCLGIVFFSNSGGPLTCAMVAALGWLFWFLRTKMPAMRVSIFAILIALVLVMESPLWYLLAKVSDIAGGDGWHRAYLMDIAFRNLDQWWLVGMSVLKTKDWFPYTVVTGGADIINYYLDFGVAAGLAATGLFCFLLVRAFSRLGRALEAVRSSVPVYRDNEFLLWALGVVLSVHVFNWFGMVYFDQYYAVFFMQLATLSTLCHQCIAARRKHRYAPVQEFTAHPV